MAHNENKNKHIKDKIYNIITYIASSLGVLCLTAILIFIFSNGMKLLSFDLLISDSSITKYNVSLNDTTSVCNCEIDESILEEGTFYSPKWGIGFKDDLDLEGYDTVVVSYIHPDSPFNTIYDMNDETKSISITSGSVLEDTIYFQGIESAYISDGAEILINGTGITKDGVDQKSTIGFEQATEVYSFTVLIPGGGIRGSIITTLYLIVLTLVIALPLGICTAIYLSEFAKDTYLTRKVRSFIELLTGVPSIIYGLLGLALFFPITELLGATESNIISGALTLAIILLPIIIRSTEEALNIVPRDLREASLAIGANHTQTTFKVVLPSAIPGILTGVILSIGRIVGESAALIFAIGTVIRDDIELLKGSTTLAVHIWSIMGGESPNYDLACTIAIVILVIVLALNLTVKYITSKFNKAIY